MIYPAYTRNTELSNFAKQLEELYHNSQSFQIQYKKFCSRKLSKDIFNERLRHILLGWMDHLASTHPPAVNRVIIMQLGKSKEYYDYSWEDRYEELRIKHKKCVELGEQYFFKSSNKLRNQLSENADQFLYLLSKANNQIKQMLIDGTVDQCVLPKKKQMSNIPSSGIILAFDLVDSQKLTDKDQMEMYSEAKRVGFQLQAWLGDTAMDGLFLYFVDQNDNPAMTCAERALRCAIEIIARITYKFPIYDNTPLIDQETRDDNPKPHLQKIRLVLNYFKDDAYSNSLAEISKVLDNPHYKFHNTIFIIGEDLLNHLDDKKTYPYKLNFRRMVTNHIEIGKPIFWSSPIGWDNLELCLTGSRYLENEQMKYRFKRYQVPGHMKISIIHNDNGVSPLEGLIFDLSQNGMRLGIDIPYKGILDKYKIGDVIKLEGNPDFCSILEPKQGEIVHKTGTKIYFLGIHFTKNICCEDLTNFLSGCHLKNI